MIISILFIAVRKISPCLFVSFLACLMLTNNIYAQSGREITGTVTDSSGESIPGVNVHIKGTTVGVITGITGVYSITVPDENAILSFSFIGFETQEIRVGNQTIIDVVMKDDAIQIEGVVVTALGIKRSEKSLSYNVQEIDRESVNAVKDANFITSLAGKVAGLEIKSVAGGMGASSRVTMRGVRSISQNNNVLYVIDGIPIYNYAKGNLSDEYAGEVGTESIADINPDDIESVNVLKGPAASALYGLRGQYGVIIITTKKGKRGLIGKTQFGFPIHPLFCGDENSAICSL